MEVSQQMNNSIIRVFTLPFIALLPCGCVFVWHCNYKQFGTVRADGIRLKVTNLAGGGDYWPTADVWYERFLGFEGPGDSFEPCLNFRNYGRNASAVKVLEVTVRSPDGSWSVPARKLPEAALVRSPYEWYTETFSFLDVLRFRICKYFAVDDLEWDLPEGWRKSVVLTVRFLVRTKAGQVTEYSRDVKLHRVIVPFVVPMTR